MNNILRKELKLAASPIAYFFIAFGLMFFLPGYPVLCGPFFVCLGIFKNFEYSREAGDITFSMLLPVSKRDIVWGKLAFTCIIEAASLIVIAVATVLRMSVFEDAEIYLSNALMNANLFALGMACLIFGLFNLIFVSGFFKTAYKTGKPFIWFIAICFLVITMAEAVHFIPGAEVMNAFGTEHFTIQLISLIILVAISIAMTYLAYRISARRFEKIDI